MRVAARNAGDIGRYTFRYQAATYVPPLPGYHAADRFWWLDPAGPVSFWLYGLEDYFVIQVLQPMTEITVYGRGVGVRLLGENRAVLAEGTEILTPAERRGEKIGERVAIGHLSVGGSYVMQLLRETLNAGEPTHLGAIEGTIEIHGSGYVRAPSRMAGPEPLCADRLLQPRRAGLPRGHLSHRPLVTPPAPCRHAQGMGSTSAFYHNG